MGLLGDITRTIFGGKKEKSQSGNHAYDWIKSNYGSWAGTGTQGVNMLGNVLGLGGSGASSQALDDYWKSSGGDFLLNQGVDAINSNMYARGLGNSGAAMKGLEEFRSDLSSTKLDNYLGQLNDLAKLSLGAGGLIGDAGQFSKGSGTSSSGGLGKFLGSALAMISDPDLKTDKRPVGTVTVWDWRYLWDPPGTHRRGFMADEVEEVHPDAMGPRVAGFRTIDPLALVGAK